MGGQQRSQPGWMAALFWPVFFGGLVIYCLPLLATALVFLKFFDVLETGRISRILIFLKDNELGIIPQLSSIVLLPAASFYVISAGKQAARQALILLAIFFALIVASGLLYAGSFIFSDVLDDYDVTGDDGKLLLQAEKVVRELCLEYVKNAGLLLVTLLGVRGATGV